MDRPFTPKYSVSSTFAAVKFGFSVFGLSVAIKAVL